MVSTVGFNAVKLPEIWGCVYHPPIHPEKWWWLGDGLSLGLPQPWLRMEYIINIVMINSGLWFIIFLNDESCVLMELPPAVVSKCFGGKSSGKCREWKKNIKLAMKIFQPCLITRWYSHYYSHGAHHHGYHLSRPIPLGELLGSPGPSNNKADPNCPISRVAHLLEILGSCPPNTVSTSDFRASPRNTPPMAVSGGIPLTILWSTNGASTWINRSIDALILKYSCLNSLKNTKKSIHF